MRIELILRVNGFCSIVEGILEAKEMSSTRYLAESIPGWIFDMDQRFPVFDIWYLGLRLSHASRLEVLRERRSQQDNITMKHKT